jgi:hypothetical protein
MKKKGGGEKRSLKRGCTPIWKISPEYRRKGKRN